MMLYNYHCEFQCSTLLLYVTIKTMNRIKVYTLSIDVHYCNIDQNNLRRIYLVNLVHLSTKPI